MLHTLMDHQRRVHTPRVARAAAAAAAGCTHVVGALEDAEDAQVAQHALVRQRLHEACSGQENEHSARQHERARIAKRFGRVSWGASGDALARQGRARTEAAHDLDGLVGAVPRRLGGEHLAARRLDLVVLLAAATEIQMQSNGEDDEMQSPTQSDCE